MMHKIKVIDAADYDEVEEVNFSPGSGIDYSLGSDRTRDRNSIIGEAMLYVGHIAALGAAVKTLLEVKKLASSKEDTKISIEVECLETGRKVKVIGDDPQKLQSTLKEVLDAK